MNKWVLNIKNNDLRFKNVTNIFYRLLTQFTTDIN